MSQEFGETRFCPCHKDKGLEYIGNGVDSTVFRWKDLVVKSYKFVYEDEYTPILNQSLLNDYYEITNLASSLSKKNNFELQLSHSNKIYPVIVNPFYQMHKCAHCCSIEGIAKYIEGVSLLNFYPSEDADLSLQELGRHLEQALGFSGMDIIPLNVKVINNNSIVITDLCADISLLHRNKLNV